MKEYDCTTFNLNIVKVKILANSFAEASRKFSSAYPSVGHFSVIANNYRLVVISFGNQILLAIDLSQTTAQASVIKFRPHKIDAKTNNKILSEKDVVRVLEYNGKEINLYWNRIYQKSYRKKKVLYSNSLVIITNKDYATQVYEFGNLTDNIDTAPAFSNYENDTSFEFKMSVRDLSKVLNEMPTLEDKFSFFPITEAIDNHFYTLFFEKLIDFTMFKLAYTGD